MASALSFNYREIRVSTAHGPHITQGNDICRTDLELVNCSIKGGHWSHYKYTHCNSAFIRNAGSSWLASLHNGRWLNDRDGKKILPLVLEKLILWE